MISGHVTECAHGRPLPPPQQKEAPTEIIWCGGRRQAKAGVRAQLVLSSRPDLVAATPYVPPPSPSLHMCPAPCLPCPALPRHSPGTPYFYCHAPPSHFAPPSQSYYPSLTLTLPFPHFHAYSLSCSGIVHTHTGPPSPPSLTALPHPHFHTHSLTLIMLFLHPHCLFSSPSQ